MERLYRSRRNAIFAGICTGIAEYYNVDLIIVRFIWLLPLALIRGPVIVIIEIVLYIIAWIIIPQEP